MFVLDDGITEIRFTKEQDFRKAEFFLGKSDLLFALACDFPGFYKMPMAYLAACRAELKRIGFQVERGKLKSPVFTYQIFYLGPRRTDRYGCAPRPKTKKEDATSFKIRFYGFPEGDSVSK